MHNYQATGEFNKSHWLKNSPVLEKHVDYQCYNIWIPVYDFYAPGATLSLYGSTGLVVGELPDGDTTSFNFSYRVPTYWLNGAVSARIHYLSSKTEAANIRLQLALVGSTHGNAVSTATQATVSLDQTNVGATYTITDLFREQDLGNNNYPVDQSYDLVHGFLRRNGALAPDTYTGTMYLIGMELIYKEIKHNSPETKQRRTEIKEIAI